MESYAAQANPDGNFTDVPPPGVLWRTTKRGRAARDSIWAESAVLGSIGVTERELLEPGPPFSSRDEADGSEGHEDFVLGAG
jgi:hypothetical protein